MSFADNYVWRSERHTILVESLQSGSHCFNNISLIDILLIDNLAIYVQGLIHYIAVQTSVAS